jgi:hypothetical protein
MSAKQWYENLMSFFKNVFLVVKYKDGNYHHIAFPCRLWQGNEPAIIPFLVLEIR